MCFVWCGGDLVVNSKCCAIDWMKCKWITASPGRTAWIPGGREQSKRKPVVARASVTRRNVFGSDRSMNQGAWKAVMLRQWSLCRWLRLKNCPEKCAGLSYAITADNNFYSWVQVHARKLDQPVGFLCLNLQKKVIVVSLSYLSPVAVEVLLIWKLDKHFLPMVNPNISFNLILCVQHTVASLSWTAYVNYLTRENESKGSDLQPL